ncbi:MAG: serine/threonine-protein kinase [Deltaproteobacteria bacterium]
MHSKRDLQFVRLAGKWRWLTGEEGEDVMFLLDKFEGKLAIEEIVRRRNYLDEDQIQQLAEATDRVVGKKPRAPTVARPAIPRNTGPSGDVTIMGGLTTIGRPPVAPDGRPDPTFFGQSPFATILDGGIPQGVPVRGAKPAPTQWDDTPADNANPERTIIAPMPDAVREARRKLEQQQKSTRIKQPMEEEAPTATDLSRDELLAAAHAAGVVIPSEMDQEPAERTIFEPRRYAYELPSSDDEPVPLPADALVPVEEPLVVGVEPGTDPLREISDAGALGRPTSEIEAATVDGTDFANLAHDPEAAERLLGEFGGYTLERVVARGGRSLVYAGVQTETGYPVAVKMLLAEHDEASRFVMERGDDLLAAARVSSPHVVRVVDVGRVEGRYYVALDYVEGWTLEEKIAAGERPPVLEALTIARDVARGLADAEVVGLIHRDIRPGNVILGADGALITGFGFHRDTMGLAGTTGYIAPERFAGSPSSTATDLYALGVMLFRLLTGELPFSGEDAQAIASAAAVYDASDVRTYHPDIPPEVAQVVAALLSREPAARGGTATAVAGHLDRLTFDVEAAGLFAAEAERGPPPLKPIALQTGAFSAALLVLAVLLPLGATALELVDPSTALDAALFGALFSIAATTLLTTIALIRRGQIPLTMSSTWLVRAQEALGALGTGLLVAGFVVSSPAFLNVFVSFLAVIVLVSWVFGFVLRRAVASAREDGGVGRMLAVLGDPTMTRWRVVHAPLLAALTCLATTRYLLIAYFAAG